MRTQFAVPPLGARESRTDILRAAAEGRQQSAVRVPRFSFRQLEASHEYMGRGLRRYRVCIRTRTDRP
jgi:hypothetical protein